MADLLTAIRSINGPPTYTFTMNENQVVTRDPLTVLELHRDHQFPAALLEEGAQTVDPRFEQSAAFVPRTLSMSHFLVTVLALVRHRTGVNTELNAWLADLLQAVQIDPYRGGLAQDTLFQSITPPREDRIIPDYLAAAELRLMVKYVHPMNLL